MICSGIVSACQNPALQSKPLTKDKIRTDLCLSSFMQSQKEQIQCTTHIQSCYLPETNLLTSYNTQTTERLTSIGTGCSVGNFTLQGTNITILVSAIKMQFIQELSSQLHPSVLQSSSTSNPRSQFCSNGFSYLWITTVEPGPFFSTAQKTFNKRTSSTDIIIRICSGKVNSVNCG